MADSLKVHSEVHANVGLIRLFGEFDLAGADEYSRELNELDKAKPDRVILDLRGLSFMDSTGIRLLLGTKTRFDPNGSRGFAIIPGPPPVMRVLEVAGLTGVLPSIGPGEVPEALEPAPGAAEVPAE